MKGAGFVWSDDGTYQLVAPNLTPDEETGILRWSDAQLGRAIRQGIAHDGRRLDRTMPAFRHLADEDLAAVIAYLRSLPPVRNPLPRTVLPAAEQTSNDRRPPVRLKPRALANGADPVERGRTLVLLGECTGCHTSWHSPRMPGLLGGGNLIRNGERASFSTNLTPHPSGMPYDAEAFIHVLRTGKRGGLRPLMPWIVYRNLSDDDLRAMHAFLRTMYPVAHYVGNSAEPTQCPVCGQVHPLGELNHIETPQRVVPDPLLVADYVGKYHSEEWGFTVIVTRSGDRLFAQWNARPRIELHPLSDTLFTAELAPLRFIRDADGNVARIVSLEVEEVVLEKVR